MYFINIAASISQFFNVLVFNGHPDESISARCWREDREIYKVINKIFFWEDNHCRNAHMMDINRAEWLQQNRRS